MTRVRENRVKTSIPSSQHNKENTHVKLSFTSAFPSWEPVYRTAV